jgi:hypothetical protein
MCYIYRGADREQAAERTKVDLTTGSQFSALDKALGDVTQQ